MLLKCFELLRKASFNRMKNKMEKKNNLQKPQYTLNVPPTVGDIFFLKITAAQTWFFIFVGTFQRFAPIGLTVHPWLFAVFPELHCVDCFFLGAGAFVLPLKALVGSSLLK